MFLKGIISGSSLKVLSLLASQIEERKKETLNKITSLDSIPVHIPDRTNIRRDGNVIIHDGSNSDRNVFIGEEMKNV